MFLAGSYFEISVITGNRFLMGCPYLDNRTSQRVVLDQKLFANIDIPKEAWTFFAIRCSSWPELARFWPIMAKIKKSKLHVRDSSN